MYRNGIMNLVFYSKENNVGHKTMIDLNYMRIARSGSSCAHMLLNECRSLTNVEGQCLPFFAMLMVSGDNQPSVQRTST